MEAAAFDSLFLILGNTQLTVLSCCISERPGEHGTLCADAQTQAEWKDYLLYEEDAYVGLFAIIKNSVQPLFYGVVMQMEVKVQGGRCVLHLEALTESCRMDFAVKNRSFQDIAMTSHELIKNILKPYEKSQVLFSIENKPLNQIAVQYQETDWEFLKRILSFYGVSACAAANQPGICIRAGFMDTCEDADWELLPYTLQRNMAQTDKKSVKKAQICYQIETYDIFPLGEKVTFKGKELYIGKIERFLRQGLLVNQYELYFAEGMKVSKFYNPLLSGVSINGEVEAVSRNRIQARLETDALSNCQKKYYFPFSTVAASPDGNGWYCMPKKGDRIRIFFPAPDEAQGYAIANIQSSSGGNPDLKDITMPDQKSMRFVNGGIQLDVGGGNGSVTLTNDGTASISTGSNIQICAAGAVSFCAQKTISVSADSKIEFLNDAGGNITITAEAVEIDAKKILSN